MSLSRNCLPSGSSTTSPAGVRDEAEDLRGLHYLQQVGEFELQIARDAIAVVAAPAILERLQQPEDPRQTGNPESD